MSSLKQYTFVASSAAQLVQEVEAAVADGRLAPGDPLPSVRRLAASVGLSPVTVSTALGELRRRGTVVSEPRRGSRIGDGPAIALGSGARPSAPPGARDLSLGNPDSRLLPALAPMLARMRPHERLYGAEPGLPALVEELRARMLADGLPAAGICIVSGALDGIERVLRAHLRPGDRVAVEDPGYADLFHSLRAHGLSLEPVAVDERGLRPDALRAALAAGASALVVTPRGQNPTGAAIDTERAAQLAVELERRPEVLLIEDDHLGPIAGAPLRTLTAGRRRWAAARSVAKALGPDLRLAALAGDEHTLARVQGAQQRGPGWVSWVLQGLVLALLRDPDVAELTERARGCYAARRERLIELLAQRGVPAQGRAGLNVWIPAADETSTVAALLARGWVVAAGAPYRLRERAGAIRVTIATLEEHEAEQLAADIAAALRPPAPGRSG